MAKNCNCPGSGSGTRLVDGTNTTVVGIGSAQNPFKVNVTIDLNGEVIPAAGGNISMTGAGTIADPLAISVAPGVNQTEAPASGANIAIAANTALLYLDHAATIAALTLTFPNSPTALFHEVVVVSRSIVTALTLADEAGAPVDTFSGGPTTLAAGAYFRMRLVGTVWRRVG